MPIHARSAWCNDCHNNNKTGEHYVKQHVLSTITISSAYTVMLRSYLNSLSNGLGRAAQYRNLPADAYLEQRVSLEETRDLLDHIASKVGHHGFGLEVGARIHPSDYGLMGYLLMNCRDLKEASQTAARYKNVMNEGLNAQFIKDSERVFYQIENRFQLDFLAPMIELDLASAMHFAKLLAGPHKQAEIRFECVEFQHQPLQRPEYYEQFFNCPVYFGRSRNCIETRHEVVKCPVYGANPQLFALFESKLCGLEGRTRNNRPLSRRVFDLLTEHIGQEFPDSLQVAERFHMSISAFKKHLQQEGTCFQQILDEVRRQEACRLILYSKTSQKEVAYRLGFASSSAFIRAFRRWLGMSPSEYRRAGRSQQAMQL